MNSADVTKRIVIAGTYSIDPIVDVLEFWARFLGWSERISAADFNQLYQALLSPHGVLRSNEDGANVVCLRFADLTAGNEDRAAQIAAADELAGAIMDVGVRVPTLIMVGPEPSPGGAADQAHAHLADRLSANPMISVKSGGDAMQQYAVSRPIDPMAERFGVVPFTQEGIAAIASASARWYSALTRPPIKVIATDCDNTLWHGAVGEEGVDGVRIDEGHRALQRALSGQAGGGRVVCLLSKNEEADVFDVFDRRSDMELERRHLVGHRIDWNPKPANLEAFVDELDLGLNSVVFLDDNPIECAEMRAACPEVISVNVPTEQDRLAKFVEHFWLFDLPRVTAEDSRRVDMYRDGAQRSSFKRSTASLKEFIDSLDLTITLARPEVGDFARLAQLTHRTNQFNTSLARRDENDLQAAFAEAATEIRLVRVVDRFGDYGIVGLVHVRDDRNALIVEQFLLSCRALGRGVEHRMLREVAGIAVDKGLEHIEVVYAFGERNSPARRFLQQVSGDRELDPGAYRLVMATSDAAAIRFDPEQNEPPASHADATAPVRAAPLFERSELFSMIAERLNSARAVVAEMDASVRPRPESGSYVAPGAGLENDIAQIWSEVLRVAPVGAHDNFRELGGRSIDLVRIHVLLMERLGLDVDITTMFQHPTAAGLAARLTDSAARQALMNTQIAARSANMRAARLRRGGRT